MTKTIIIYGKEIKNKEGRKFTAYSYKKGEKWFTIKFKNDCENLTKEKGYLEITFENNCDNVNVVKNDNPKFQDTIWIKTLISSRVAEDYINEIKEKKSRTLNEIFE